MRPPIRNARRLGPPPSLPKGKREPHSEFVAVPGVKPPNLKTLAPSREEKKVAPVGLPDQARAEKGLSLKQMMRRQPRYIVNSGEDVVIRSYKPKKTKGGMPAIIGTSRDMHTKPMRIHQFQVIGLNKEKSSVSKQEKIKVSCGCEFFTFYSEYALWTWGAANIRYSNGQPARVRNPGNHPVICKHLAKVLQTIATRGD